MNQKKKIVLTYAWGTPNAGDHALTIGAIELLTKFVPQSDLIVISRFSSKLDLKDPTNDIKNKYPDVTVLESPFQYSRKTVISRFLEKLHGSLMLLGIYLLPQISIKLFKHNSALQAIHNAKIVLCNGGNLFYWNEHRKSLPRLLALALPLIMAKRLNIPYAFLPQTMGPIENRFLLNFFISLIQTSKFTLFRDTNSLNYMQKYLLPTKTTIDLAPDLAFVLSNAYKNMQNSVEEKLSSIGLDKKDKFIAITLRASKLGDPEGLTGQRVDEDSISYVTNYVANVVMPVAEKNNLNILIVEQTDVDDETSKHFEKILKKKFQNKIAYISHRDPLFLSAIYLKSECLVGMRLHSLIFALRVHKPAFAIYLKQFGPKTPGIYNSLKLDKYCVDMDEIDAIQAAGKLQDMLKNKNQLSDEIKTNLMVQIANEYNIISKHLT